MRIVLIVEENKPFGLEEIGNFEILNKHGVSFYSDLPVKPDFVAFEEHPPLDTLVEIEIPGVGGDWFGYFYEDELGWIHGLVGKSLEQVEAFYNRAKKCRFLKGKMQCSNRKRMPLCSKVKANGECPIDKRIPGGRARDIWGMWLDNGGDKNIEVEDFMKRIL